MSVSFMGKLFASAAAFLAAGLVIRFLLPVALPFLAGGLLALVAEPLVALSQRRLKLPRGAATGVGVTVTLTALLALLSVLGALLVKQVGRLADAVPDIESTARQGAVLLEGFLLDITQQLPEGVRPAMTRTVTNLFEDGSAVVDHLTQKVPSVVSTVLGRVPNSALSVGTGLISGFMISARLPKLKKALRDRLPESWHTKYLPALRRMRRVLGLWLKAQGKLALLTYGIVTAGLLILGIDHAPVLGALVALVDAVPMLGSGIVLVPWALVSLLQQAHLRAIGLLCIYAAAFLSRSILEPRVVGRQLGLDPLVTLFALYAGFRFWGIPGLLLAPLLATAVKTLLEKQ